MDNKIAELAEQISIMKRQLTKAINSGNEAKALKLIKIKEELDKDFEELLQQVAIAEERERKAEEESHNEIEDERVETEHKTGSGLKKKILKLKKRPPRVYVTKTGRFYIIKNGNKIYIQIPKTEKPISQKQLQKQIVNVVLTHPKYYVPIKRRKRTFSKTGKVYFQKPFVKGLVASKFGYANTQKSIVGKEISPGIYEPHTLPNFTPRPTLKIPVSSKADIAIQNTPLTLDQETQISNTEEYKNLVNKGIIALEKARKEPKKKGFTAMTTIERNAYYKKLERIYPDYVNIFKEAQLLGKNASINLIRKTNLPVDRLVQNVDEFLPLFENYPHELRDEVIANLYKTRLRKPKEIEILPEEESKEEAYKKEEKIGDFFPEPENRPIIKRRLNDALEESKKEPSKSDQSLALLKSNIAKLPPLSATVPGKKALKIINEEEKKFVKGLSKNEKDEYEVMKDENKLLRKTKIYSEEINDRLEEMGYFDRRDALRDEFRDKLRKQGLTGTALGNAVEREVKKDKKLQKMIEEVKAIENFEDTMDARISLGIETDYYKEYSPGVSPIYRTPTDTRSPLPPIYTPKLRIPSNRTKELAKEASKYVDKPMSEEERLLEIERLKSIENPTKADKVALSYYIRNLPAKLGQEDEDQSDISGAGKYSNWRKGLYDTEIHKIMEHKAKRFVPVIMSDEIPKLLPYVNQKTKEFAFVINSTSSKTSGQHWRAIFIDVPNSEIDYYDSLVSSPTKEFLRDIKLLIDKIDPNTYMKLKINMIKQQADDTENCGFFACKFIIDRFKNKAFKNACGSDKSDIGEYEIEKFKNYL